MKVLFFEPYAHYNIHFGTALELMQRHLNAGDEVLLLGCNAAIAACDINPEHKWNICTLCQSKRRKGLKKLSRQPQYRPFPWVTQEQQQRIDQLQVDFPSLEALKEYRVGHFDIGYAVASTLIWHYRNPELPLADYRQVTANLIRTAFVAYFSMENYLEDFAPDRVYLFNGRLGILRGVLRLCQQRGVDCYIHERGADLKKFMLYKNHLPHNREKVDGLIRQHWEEAGDGKWRIADEYYQRRRAGASLFSYTTRQAPGKLPEQWDADKEHVVLFNSSEDEFASIGKEWDIPFYRDQLDGIQQLAAHFKDDPARQFFLRIHPNLAKVDNPAVRQLYELGQPNFFVIPPGSDVSSYDLMLEADKVITFGSTTGIEAAYWGKASILLRPCYYYSMGSTYNPGSHEETCRLIATPHLPAKDKTGAMMYGFYRSTFGTPFQYFEGLDYREGKFKGEPLEPENWLKLLLQAKEFLAG